VEPDCPAGHADLVGEHEMVYLLQHSCHLTARCKTPCLEIIIDDCCKITLPLSSVFGFLPPSTDKSLTPHTDEAVVTSCPH